MKKWRSMVVLVVAATVASTVVSAAGSAGSTASVKTTVYRWGVVGNRGAVTQLELSKPTPIEGIKGTVVQIATSNSDGYALTSKGSVFAWGVNSYGELGDGHKTPYETKAVKVAFPRGVRITTLANPMPFDAGIAIDSTGHAWGWGLDVVGDLCRSPAIMTKPGRLPLSDVTLATGARTHSLFDAHGRVLACGSNEAGELGNGSTTAARTPTPVVGLPRGHKVVALTSSWEGSGALLADGTYFDWGYNAAGQLGNGVTTNSPVPVKVHLPGAVRQVFQGGSGAKNGQTMAILRDGALFAWGSNSRGQLGTGNRVDATTPVAVHVPRHVAFVKVCSGGFASYAIDSRGRLWAWGDNHEGQLADAADGKLATRPVEVGIRVAQVSSTAQNVAGLHVGH